jgi:hypothetical protein
MDLIFEAAGAPLEARISDLVIAGWTGRDPAAIQHHIEELRLLGVRPPRQVPMFYRVSAGLLTTASDIEVIGEDSSGEVEFVLVSLPQGLYVGVGSDHTDRKVEAYGVTVSKQICPKPLGRDLWKLADVQDHWNELILRSHVIREGTRQLYQEGSVSRIREPLDLVSRFTRVGNRLPVATAMYCGTLPAMGPIAGGERFEIELFDPVRDRSLLHSYAVRHLAVVD